MKNIKFILSLLVVILVAYPLVLFGVRFFCWALLVLTGDNIPFSQIFTTI